MTHDEAERLLENYLSRENLSPDEVRSWRAANWLGVMAGSAQIYFQYLPAREALRTSALVYRFDEEIPAPLLEAFAAESLRVSTGGGRVEYMFENKGLYLSREDDDLNFERFVAQTDALAKASLVWSREVFERVVERVYTAKSNE